MSSGILVKQELTPGPFCWCDDMFGYLAPSTNRLATKPQTNELFKRSLVYFQNVFSIIVPVVSEEH